MNGFKLLLRRVAGIFRWIFRGRKARKLLRDLKKVDISGYVTRMVSDAVLLNQIPSPSDGEKLRMDFITGRLADFGISNVEVDDGGNILALFPAFGTQRNFLLVAAEVGDSDYSALGSAVNLTDERASGQGLGETSLGVAALVVLAEYAQTTGFHLDKNLLLVFTRSSSVDEKELAFRHFLELWGDRISCGIMIRGTGFGVVESRQVGSCRLTITVRTPERELLSIGSGGASTASAAAVLGSIAFQIGGVSWEAKEAATVNIARMESGVGYGHWPTEGTMDIEILAEEERMLETIKNVVSGTAARAAAGAGATVEVDVRSQHSVGDSMKNAPLTDALRVTLSTLKLKPEIGIISEKVAMLNDFGIPGIALGITLGKKTADEDYVELKPMATGFRQLLLMVERCATMRDTRGDESQ
ncbi:MAG TPA: hypothetical protein VMV90_04535 [Rectinemataceae bacterium]|nr:hypothetical protein [Rectinemataceae bacterium]